MCVVINSGCMYGMAVEMIQVAIPTKYEIASSVDMFYQLSTYLIIFWLGFAAPYKFLRPF